MSRRIYRCTDRETGNSRQGKQLRQVPQGQDKLGVFVKWTEDKDGWHRGEG